MKKPKIFYGWWIVAASFICIFIYSGVGYYANSLFIEPLYTQFGWGRAQISFGFTVIYTSIALSSPFIGRIIDHYGPKKTIVAGAFMVGTGFILLSRIQSLWQYYLAYILVGLGNSCSGFMAMSTVISRWFSKRRGTALGIAMTGIGVGGIVVAPLIGDYIIPNFGWRNAFLSMALFVWGIVLPVTLLVIKSRPSDMGLHPDGALRAEDVQPAKSARVDSEGWTRGMAMRTLPFWLMVISFSAGSFGNTSVVQHQVPHLSDIGLNAIAATVLGVVGIGSTIGKFVFGWLTDHVPVKYSQLLCFTSGTIAIIIFMNVSSSTSITVIWTYAMFMGLAMGGWASNTPMLLTTMFGLSSYGAIYGAINLPIMLATAWGPYAAGYIFDITQSYSSVFTIALGLYAVAIVSMVLVHHPKPRSNTSY